jgi:predicted DNA-binding protein YlxM (UPF0122 family)
MGSAIRTNYFVTTKDKSDMKEMYAQGYNLRDIADCTGFSTGCVHRQINEVVNTVGDRYNTQFDPSKHLHGSRGAANDAGMKETAVKTKFSKLKETVNSDRKTIQITGKSHGYIAVMSELTGKTHMQIVDEMVQAHKEQTKKLLQAA